VIPKNNRGVENAIDLYVMFEVNTEEEIIPDDYIL
jgi:hypothetical protein